MRPFACAEANSLPLALDLVAAEGALSIADGTDLLRLLQEDVLQPFYPSNARPRRHRRRFMPMAACWCVRPRAT